MMKQFGMLQKYAKLTSKEITPAIVAEISTSFGFRPTAEQMDAITEFVHQGDEESVASYLGKPENLKRMKELLEKGNENTIVLRCTHCHNLIALNMDVE